jgi:hypothetical protein
MGVDLSGAGGCEWLSWTVWGNLLNLAREYGWEPAGTEPPSVTVKNPDGSIDHEMSAIYSWSYGGWDGTYFTNNCQLVTDEDAASIAEALEQALGDIPDEGTVETVRVINLDPSLDAGSKDPDHDAPVRSVEKFGGSHGKQLVKDFIVYCRAGGFAIG